MSRNKLLLEALKTFEQNVMEAAKANLRKQGASGKLAESMDSEIQVMPNSIRLFFKMSYYGWFQDQGVKGIKSGKSLSNFSYKRSSKLIGFERATGTFAKWAKKKGIQFRKPKRKNKIKKTTKGAGQFMSHEQTGLAIAGGIKNKGIKPSMFFTKPFQNHYKQLPGILVEAHGEDSMRILGDIIDENLKNYYE
jgi:hypothetical protein